MSKPSRSLANMMQKSSANSAVMLNAWLTWREKFNPFVTCSNHLMIKSVTYADTLVPWLRKLLLKLQLAGGLMILITPFFGFPRLLWFQRTLSAGSSKLGWKEWKTRAAIIIFQVLLVWPEYISFDSMTLQLPPRIFAIASTPPFEIGTLECGKIFRFCR